MQYLYGAIPNSCWAETVTWLHPYRVNITNKLVISDIAVFGVEYISDKDLYREFCGFCRKNFWLFNATRHGNNFDYWMNNSVWHRYDHQGNIEYKLQSTPAQPEVREVLHQMIRLDENDSREKDRLFHAYLLNTDWENQLEHGKLAQMRQLLGAD